MHAIRNASVPRLWGSRRHTRSGMPCFLEAGKFHRGVQRDCSELLAKRLNEVFLVGQERSKHYVEKHDIAFFSEDKDIALSTDDQEKGNEVWLPVLQIGRPDLWRHGAKFRLL